MNKTISMLLVLIVIFSGCTHIIENSTNSTDIPVIFEEMTFRRNDDYGRTFKMMYGESNGISIGLLKDLYEKEEMQTTANLIKEDIKLLVSTLDIDEAEEIKIYVLEKTIAGGSYSKNNNMFCSKEDLINGNYRLSLIQSYLNLSEPWMMYGIHGKVFEKDADNVKLNDFYTNNDDKHTRIIWCTFL